MSQFASPLNNTAQYWVGLLLADGSVRFNKNNARITLRITDLDCAQKFNTFMGNNTDVRTINRDSEAKPFRTRGKVYVSHRKPIHQVSTVCNDSRDRLQALGLTESKELTAQVSAEVFGSSHFWRGVIDGDGCVGNYSSPYLKLVGTKEVCEAFEKYVRILTGSKEKKVKLNGPEERCFRIDFTGKVAKRVIEELYASAPEEARMNRKYEKSILILGK